MSTTTTNFGIVMPEGTDTFNPLTFNNTAFIRVDEVMKNNQDRGVTPATHVFIDGVNTISRNIPTCNMLVFIATSDYVSGSTIAVDGVTCTLRYADGSAPANNAFRTNQAVVCYLNGTILTIVSAASITDIIGSLNDLTTDDKNNVVAAINEVDGNVDQVKDSLSDIFKIVSYTYDIAQYVANTEITVLPTNAPVPEGYTYAGVRLVNTGAGRALIRAFNGVNGSITILPSSNGSGTPSMSILCIKSTLVG